MFASTSYGLYVVVFDNANEVEKEGHSGEISEVYRIRRELTGNLNSCRGPINDKNGAKITKEHVEYVQQFLNLVRTKGWTLNHISYL